MYTYIHTHVYIHTHTYLYMYNVSQCHNLYNSLHPLICAWCVCASMRACVHVRCAWLGGSVPKNILDKATEIKKKTTNVSILITAHYG